MPTKLSTRVTIKRNGGNKHVSDIADFLKNSIKLENMDAVHSVVRKGRADSVTTATITAASSSMLMSCSSFRTTERSENMLHSTLKRSISKSDVDAVDTRKQVWEQLTPPDMCKVLSRANKAHHDEQHVLLMEDKKTVSFDTVHIREYKQTVVDNPSVTHGGPPIGLDWQYQELGTIDVSAFDSGRAKFRRDAEELVLSNYARMIILGQRCGIPKKTLIAAGRAATRAQKQRQKNNMLLPVSLRIKAAMANTGMRVKRSAGAN